MSSNRFAALSLDDDKHTSSSKVTFTTIPKRGPMAYVPPQKRQRETTGPNNNFPSLVSNLPKPSSVQSPSITLSFADKVKKELPVASVKAPVEEPKLSPMKPSPYWNVKREYEPCSSEYENDDAYSGVDDLDSDVYGKTYNKYNSQNYYDNEESSEFEEEEDDHDY
jgi:hypothetical protein